MTKREKAVFDDLMDLYEFEVIHNNDDTLSVCDLTGACWGSICDEKFEDEFEILERMTIYHEGYLICSLEETFDTRFDNYGDWLLFLKEQNDEDYGYDIAVLSLIVNNRLDI